MVNKRSVNIFIIIAIMFCAGRCLADTQIKSEVDKTTVRSGEFITYKLIITSSEKKLPQPKIAEFKGFKVVSQANSSTVSFIKGDIKTILVFAFILLPEGTGKFTIDKSSIKVADKEIFSEKLDITVVEKEQGADEPLENSPMDGSKAEQYNI